MKILHIFFTIIMTGLFLVPSYPMPSEQPFSAIAPALPLQPSFIPPIVPITPEAPVASLPEAPLQQTTDFTSSEQASATVSPQSTIVTGPETTQQDPNSIGIQGNWVKKREWLINAHDVNNEIQDITTKIEAVRRQFIEAYDDIDAALDAYYKELSLDEGKIQGLFASIDRYLKKKKKKEVTALTTGDDQKKGAEIQAKIDIIERKMGVLKEQLEQLKLDMQSVEDLDRSLSDRLKRLDEQIKNIQDEADKATEITNKLWEIIDHNKARDLYYDLKLTILEKIKNIQSYLQSDLFQDFQSVIATVKSQIAKTQDQAKSLENDGLFIRERAQRVKETKVEELEKMKKIEEEKKFEESRPKPVDVPAPLPPSWLDKIYDSFIDLLAMFYNSWLWITGGNTTETKTTPVSPQQQ